MSTQPAPQQRESLFSRALHPILLLGVMWAIQLADAITPGSWNGVLAIESWRLRGLDGVILSPLLHSGWGHLLANSAPFALLGILVALDGARRFWGVTAVVAVVAGLGTWFVNSPGTLTVGASGLVFGYFGSLLVRAFVAPSLGHGILYALIAIGVAGVYGGAMFAGIFSAGSGISWQAHLFGAIGGGVAAVAFRPRR
ncbi:MAG TPA: rhomboid family intramembrane serine protease [Microbacterium sp.]|nr:rhomboid family intramembrane serine protease [Microbacterium sp.]